MNEAVAEVAQAVARRSARGWSTDRRRGARAYGAGASLRHERIGIDVMGGEPGLHHRDQRRDRGERELEADAENDLRLDGDTARTAKARLRIVTPGRP